MAMQKLVDSSVATQGCTNSEAACFWSLKNYSLSHDQTILQYKHLDYSETTIVKKNTTWHKQKLFCTGFGQHLGGSVRHHYPCLHSFGKPLLKGKNSWECRCRVFWGLLVDIISNMIVRYKQYRQCIMNTVTILQSVHTIRTSNQRSVCQVSSMLYRIK